MPEPIRAGEILRDISKGEWILGESIGVGGFGEVYSGMRNKFYYIAIVLYRDYILAYIHKNILII